MTDKREQILSAIFDTLQSVDGFETCSRNRDQLPADKRPALILLDGDESAKRDADGRGRVAASPNRIIMTPEVFIVLDTRKPKNESIGQDLNALRAAVLKALLTTSAITDLCENVFYTGCITDLAKDRVMDGQVGLAIEYTYLLKPNEL